MDFVNKFQIEATLVANEFIDRYMAAANGEYVKVYLYILRHAGQPLEIGAIADALNHTEADVNRAIAYWEKLGILGGREREEPKPEQRQTEQAKEEMAAARQPQKSRPACTPEQIGKLQGDPDFAQLLYIAQRYMNKIFTQREVESFAYLYGTLGMSEELLEYLVEYCAQSGHTSIRYVETVALNWHERNLKTVDEAQAYASSFTKDSFAVMRAFGLADRRPGDGERQLIERWFREYGFTKEVVLEACRRTLEATNKPSFRYADKILSEWKKTGVKGLNDIAALDEKRRAQGTKQKPVKKTPNQFHNFEQRDTDYNALVMDQVRGWLDET